jgi:hypothetical protein
MLRIGINYFNPFLIVTLGLLLATGEVHCQDYNYRVNALYVYNIAKYIDWSEINESETITIGIIGDSPVFDHLKSITANKKIYGKDFLVKHIDAIDAAACHMVIVSKNVVNKTLMVSESVKNTAVLIITEKRGFTKKGAQICFYVDDEDSFKTKIELSKSNLEKSHIKVSQELITLSEIMN